MRDFMVIRIVVLKSCGPMLNGGGGEVLIVSSYEQGNAWCVLIKDQCLKRNYDTEVF